MRLSGSVRQRFSSRACGGVPIFLFNQKLTPAECADKHTKEFLEKHHDCCANNVMNWRQFLFYWIICPIILLEAFVCDYKVAFALLTFILCGFYGAVIAFRLMSVMLAMLRKSEHRITTQQIDALQDADLPMYTVLVPMYKEPEVAQKIARTVTKLNYPIDKLDVKLLLEEDDAPTRAKIDEVIGSLPPCVEVVIAPKVPQGQPRTKPRALNWGLEKARGKYLVVFDAEDQPEADQLKKAVVAFAELDKAGKSSVACLQAKLNYFNARQNMLTRFFTLEYTNCFDLFLPGLHAMRSPIPLGGTSNHFRVELLRQTGGWDPFNVTEDCDLGIRMARKGFSTEILDSTTWEEANSQVPNWIRQRSRWIKGYFQTHLVHARDAILPFLGAALVFFFLFGSHEAISKADIPEASRQNFVFIWKAVCSVFGVISLLCAAFSFIQRLRYNKEEGHLGLYRAATFRLTVGGMSIMLLLNIVFWLMTGTYLLRDQIVSVMPDAIGRIKLDETTTLKDAVKDWKLIYKNVKDEDRYSGVDLYNTASGYFGNKLAFNDVKERLDAIDNWSLVSQIFYPVAIMLFVANFIFVLLGLVACTRRRLGDLMPFAVLVPLYWVLISVAAIKGFYQLMTNPWYWEKTTHGLSEPPQAPQPPTMEPVSTAAGE